MTSTNIPILLTSPRSGSHLTCNLLKYYGANPKWVMRRDIRGETPEQAQVYEDAISENSYPLVGHLAANNTKNLGWHLERFPDSKLIVLLRQDTLRQAYSLWLSHNDGQGHISNKNINDVLVVPELTDEIAHKIYLQSHKFIRIMERLNNMLEEIEIPHMTLFYEYDLLGKGQCCLQSLAERMHYFWDIPFNPEPMPNRPFWQSVKHRKTNIKTEITYKKFLSMVGKFDA